jgi:hypothetical protein
VSEYVQCLEGGHVWALEERNVAPFAGSVHHMTVKCLRCGAVK